MRIKRIIPGKFLAALILMLAGIAYTGEGGITFAEDTQKYFKAASLSLDGLICVNFYVSADENIGGVTFDVDGRSTQTIDATTMITTNGEYKFTCCVSAVEMANTIHAELFSTTNQTLETADYSVQQYVKSYFQNYSKDFSLEADDLVQSVGEYGYYTQKFLAEAKDWTLSDGKYNAIFTSMDNEYVHELTNDELSESAAMLEEITFAKTTNNGVANVELALNLDYETSAQIYITPETGKTLTQSNITLTQIAWDDEAQSTKETDFPFTFEESGGAYVIKTGGIPAADLRLNFHLTAKFDGSSENDIDYTFSPRVYAKTILSADISSSPFTQHGKNAMAALTRYSNYAEMYQVSESQYSTMHLTYGYMGTASEQFTFNYTDNNVAQTLSVPAGGKVLLYFLSGSSTNYDRLVLYFLDASGTTLQNFPLYTCTHNDGSDSYTAKSTLGNTTLGEFTFRIAESGGKTIFTQAEGNSPSGIEITSCSPKRVDGTISRLSSGGGGGMM